MIQKKMLLISVILVAICAPGISQQEGKPVNPNFYRELAVIPLSDKGLHLENYEKYQNAAESGKTAGNFLVGVGAALIGAALLGKSSDNLAKVGIGAISVGVIAHISGSGSQSRANKELIKAIRL